MILYTVFPDEVVLEGEEGEELKRQRFIELDGRQLLIEPSGESQWKIVRLVSSDPQDYLDTRYQPGNIVPLRPQI